MPAEPGEQSPLEAGGQAAPGGLTVADILEQPEPTRGLLSWMVREAQVDLAAIAVFLGQDEAAARSLVAALVERGYVQELEVDGVTFYQVRLAPRRKSGLGAGWLPSFKDP